jgi:glycosyltransferase involved in cell wall biosynthesis
MVSVVVPTRNRPAHAAACAATILACPDLLEAIFVDQSDGRETEAALAGALRDPRFRYLRTDTRGVTSGRNAGFELCRGDVVAYTDDDCRVPPGWIAGISELFATDPDAAVMCGRVHVPDEWQERGFAIAFEPVVREWKGRFPPLGRDWGLTANMAFRRSVLVRFEGFDPLLGSGAPLWSGGEPDLLYRVLRAGLKIVNASEVSVEHIGIRKPGPEMKELWRRYAAGTSAAFFKHIRMGDRVALSLYLRFLASYCAGMLWRAVRLRRPVGVGYLIAFARGARASLSHDIDRERQHYRLRSSERI